MPVFMLIVFTAEWVFFFLLWVLVMRVNGFSWVRKEDGNSDHGGRPAVEWESLRVGEANIMGKLNKCLINDLYLKKT
jgi:hypothetical protein